MNEHAALEDPKTLSPQVRDAVLQRDHEQCQLCGTGGDNRLQLHHVQYRSQLGGHTPLNLVTLCGRCHGDVHAGRQAVELIEVDPGCWQAFPCRAPFPRRKA